MLCVNIMDQTRVLVLSNFSYIEINVFLCFRIPTDIQINIFTSSTERVFSKTYA